MGLGTRQQGTPTSYRCPINKLITVLRGMSSRRIDRLRGLVSVGLGTRIVRRSSGTVEIETREETNLTSLPIL